MPQNFINTMMVQCIIDDKIVLGVMMNMMMFISGYVRLEELSLEIENQVSIPGVRHTNEER